MYVSSVIYKNSNFSDDHGSLVVEFEGETISGKPLSMSLVGWKGTRSVRAYVTVAECVHTLRLVGEDVSKYGMYAFTSFSYSKMVQNCACIK